MSGIKRLGGKKGVKFFIGGTYPCRKSFFLFQGRSFSMNTKATLHGEKKTGNIHITSFSERA